VVFVLLLLVLGLAIYLTCELLPKRLFQKFPNRLCIYLVPVYAGVQRVLSPVVYLVGRFAALLLRITGDRALTGRLFANRDELKAMIQSSSGGLTKTEKSLIGRVLDAQNLTVGRVAQPLDRADTVSASLPVAAVLEIGRVGGHTRLPVWSGTDDPRRIVGVVSLKDRLHTDPDPARLLVQDWLRPALYLDDSVRIEEALRILQRSGQHMAIVDIRQIYQVYQSLVIINNGVRECPVYSIHSPLYLWFGQSLTPHYSFPLSKDGHTPFRRVQIEMRKP
jgi:CBS domain containing-hemolysin-like protein